MAKRVMVIGSGGREHALALAISSSVHVESVVVAPGNAGTAQRPLANVAISVTDNAAIVDYALEHDIDLVVIGPELALLSGLADDLLKAGVAVFGPTREQSRLEWSKAYCKDLLSKLAVPTAAYRVTDDAQSARQVLTESGLAVVKLDGLAAGKGVYVAENLAEALDAVDALERDFAVDGALHLVLEEKLVGEELSLFCISDGKSLLPLCALQDHKRRFAGDLGPNTGGMGAYTPVPLYARHQETINERVVKPLAEALADGRLDFKGLLFIGILMQDGVPHVLEFNTRFGDPETQAMMALLDSDIFELLSQAAAGSLDAAAPVKFKEGASVTVVAVAGNYPAGSSSGEKITVGELPAGVTLYHCGTRRGEDGTALTAGGRVLAPTAVAPTLDAARDLALAALEKIAFNGMDFRRDIGVKSLKESGACP